MIEAVNDACAQTTGPGIKLQTTADIWRGCEWELPSPVRSPQITHLSAIGLLIAQGTWIEGVDMLLRHTDELCAHALQQVDPDVASGFAGPLFASTYVFQPSGGLPVSPLVEAATNRFRFSHVNPERLGGVIDRLLPDAAEWSPGALYVAAHLLCAHDVPLRIDVILRCVESGLFHLQSAGLHLAQDRAHTLTEAQREELVDQIVALSTNNLAVHAAQIETLARLGGLSPAKSDEDIVAEIQQTLYMKGDPEADKLA